MKHTKAQHDCIEKVRAAVLKANKNMTGLVFDHANIKSTRPVKNRVIKTGQSVQYSIAHTKRDGSVVTKWKRSFIVHEFCPFCGNKFTDLESK